MADDDAPASDDPPADDPAVVRLSNARCPVCGRQAIARYRPFCSRRCADVDLGRWLTGSYAVPDHPALDDE